MGLGDGPDDGQSQALAGSRSFPCQTHEGLEHASQVVLAHRLASVADLEPSTLTVMEGGDPNLAAHWFVVPDGVLDEVENHLLEEVDVPDDAGGLQVLVHGELALTDFICAGSK